MSQAPIREAVQTELDRATSRRMWLGVTARRERRAHARRRSAFATAFAIGIAAAALFVSFRRHRIESIAAVPAFAGEAVGPRVGFRSSRQERSPLELLWLAA